jgi:prepilin-type processing-associated H-X9-DG protein
MIARELFNPRDGFPQRTVSRYYETKFDFPLMADSKPWHKGGAQYNQNALYSDGHVEWLLVDPATGVTQPPTAPP